MKPERCREWRESLGAYALGQLSEGERLGVEAHLEGCPACRDEVDQLVALAEPMALADPARFDVAAPLPSGLAGRVLGAIGRERRLRRRRRTGFGLAFGGTAVAVAAILLLFVLGGGESTVSPEQHVAFGSLPKGVQVSAKLIPNAFGTEIHMYVKGVSSGTLCRVYLESRDGSELPAGSFRYRWGDGSYPILSSGLDLAKTTAMKLQIGDRTFVAQVGSGEPGAGAKPSQEERQ
jgi:hypothetical protein